MYFMQEKILILKFKIILKIYFCSESCLKKDSSFFIMPCTKNMNIFCASIRFFENLMKTPYN